MPRAVSGRVRPSVFFNCAMYAKCGEGGGYAGGKPPDCVKVHILAAALAVAPTVAALSLLLWDVLRLLQLGMVRTFLSEGGAGPW